MPLQFHLHEILRGSVQHSKFLLAIQLLCSRDQLQSLLLLPLYVPVLVFGTGAVDAQMRGLGAARSCARA